MGAWGSESCSNDGVWDCLNAKNIHQMTQKEANDSMDRLWSDREDNKPGTAAEIYDASDKLGVVIWILSQELIVPIEKIEECLVYANKFLRPKMLESMGWKDLEERKISLEKEVKILEVAKENGGKGKKRHIKGLMEKMDIGATVMSEDNLTTEQKIREIGIIATAGEFLDHLAKMVDQHGRDLPIKITVPFRDGVGFHYKNIKNISTHEGIIDIAITIPEHDDVKRKC